MDFPTQAKFMYLLERVHDPLHVGGRGRDKDVYYTYGDSKPEEKKSRRRGERNDSDRRKCLPLTSPLPGSTNDELQDLLEKIGKVCPRRAFFSYFNPRHYKATNELQTFLMNQANKDDFLCMAAATRDNEKVNSHLWTHAISHAILHRPDMRGFRMPAIWEILPDQFIPVATLKLAENRARRKVKNTGQMTGIEGSDKSSFTSGKMEADIPEKVKLLGASPEKLLDYFREDVGVNSHHFHWHLIYPNDAPSSGRNARHRKGELFYYMHHNLIARYDAERLANGLLLTRALDYGSADCIPEAYFPQIGSLSDGVVYGSRQENTPLQSVCRIDNTETILRIDVADIYNWKYRLLSAIDSGRVLYSSGEIKRMDEGNGMEILGDTIGNGGQTAPFPKYYGFLHGLGHMLISYQHDPENRYDTQMGVMGTTTSAMRDPVFYRLHKFMDEIFNYFKTTRLSSYSFDQLNWSAVKIEDVAVTTEYAERNTLITYWTDTDVEVSRGYAFNASGPVLVPLRHLNHRSFQYKISITNNARRTISGVVRVFLAPSYDVDGSRFNFEQHRPLFFEMDKFLEELSPGANEILRESLDSTVTIPWSQGFGEIEHWLDGLDYPVGEAACGCGWPHHFLLPRGTATGMKFDLFVMVTNAEIDIVDGGARHLQASSRQSSAQYGGKHKCKESIGYCGILNELYPDKRPMGFPFDRSLENSPGHFTVEDFAKPHTNIKIAQVTILHEPGTITRIQKSAHGSFSTVDTKYSNEETSDWAHLDWHSETDFEQNYLSDDD